VSDLATVVLALAAAAGGLVARPVPLVAAALVLGGGVAVRQPALLVIAVALAASGLAARSWAGLAPPVSQRVDAVVTLVGDPHDAAGALRVDVRVGRRHVEVWARGVAAARLRDRLAGERVRISGHLEPLPETERARLAPKHVSARLTADSVGDWTPGALPTRIANNLRRTLLGGASSLPPDRRSLFGGFVLGDDRGQPPEVTFDFRASGLTHLLVVSGENVAFVLALAGPLLRRLGLRTRLVAGVGILLLFGTLTRWEPSVLRAVAMATLALVAGTLGRPASTIRLLALSVTALLLIDPLLVHSVGFQLSVGACVGIALLARPLARAIPGPAPRAQALAVTAAAQAGVAPVLIPTFGGLPVAALLANLLALPAAGPLMVWGVAAGLPAGIVGGSSAPARLAHLPTRVMVAWVAAVARVGARLPLGQLGLGHLVAIGVASVVAAMAWRRGHARIGAAAVATAVCALLLPAWSVLRPRPVDAREVGQGATLWRRGGATVLVLDGASGAPDRLLSSLTAAGVRRVDVLVAARPSAADAVAAETVQLRFATGVVLAPPGNRLARAVIPPNDSTVGVGGLVVRMQRDDRNRLAVTVATASARSPPG
jgi:competence protein ComEC